jgi:hypothetical protein
MRSETPIRFEVTSTHPVCLSIVFREVKIQYVRGLEELMIKKTRMVAGLFLASCVSVSGAQNTMPMPIPIPPMPGTGLPVVSLPIPSSPPSPASVPVPVRKVELYKNGMGFFEHTGPVKNSQSVEITLPGSQLNDVLKSLTVLDLGEGQIAGVTYDSAAPIDRRLAEIPVDLASANGIVTLLNQIRGANIELRAPIGTVTGKLLGAENRKRAAGASEAAEETFVNVLGADNRIHAIRLESAGALKLTDPALAGDLERALTILDDSHQRDTRRLRIQTSGDGERQIYIGYTSEAPIWKTTYRIVLDPERKPLLQGWAIVDNTTPMDWEEVTLSLVAGAPISFIQNLSQPVYARRPEVPIAQGIQAMPRILEATNGAVRFDVERLEEKREMMMAADTAMPAPRAAMKQSMSDAYRRQPVPTAQTAVVGEQFEYKLRQPVTIRRNESALLPILQSEIEGEKLAVYNAAAREMHPRLAFRLKNSSGLTLDGGAVTLIDSNTFAGEGLIETLQPGESRLIGYAIDPGSSVSTRNGSERQRIERVVINKGFLRLHSRELDRTVYAIRNNNDATRTLILEHPIRAGWKLIETSPEETSTNFYRFRVEVAPRSDAEFIVREERPVEDVQAVSTITTDQLAIWVNARSIDEETEASLREVAGKLAMIETLAQRITALEAEREGIFADQKRLRENLQRLGQSADETRLRQRYVKQLDNQEDRIAAINADREKLMTEHKTARQQLDKFIEGLSIDRKL